LTRGFAGGIHAEDGADREDPVLLWQDLDAVEDRNALHGALGGRDLAAGDELEPVPDLDLAGHPVEGAGGGHDREVDVDRLRATRALAQLEFHLYRRRPGASGAHRAHPVGRQAMRRHALTPGRALLTG